MPRKLQAVLGAGPALAREEELVQMHLNVLARAHDERCGMLHLQHISLAGSVERIARSKATRAGYQRGSDAASPAACARTISRCTMENADADWKMNPPLRCRADMLALRRALADGVIDLIATDHAPHTPAEKARGWEQAPFGVIGLETALGACLALVHDGTMTMERLIDAMAVKPAALLSRVDDTPRERIDPDRSSRRLDGRSGAVLLKSAQLPLRRDAL